MIEYWHKSSTGEDLHRCKGCVQSWFRIYRVPAKDNGFVKLTENPHFFSGCNEEKKRKSA